MIFNGSRLGQSTISYRKRWEGNVEGMGEMFVGNGENGEGVFPRDGSPVWPTEARIGCEGPEGVSNLLFWRLAVGGYSGVEEERGMLDDERV